MADSSLTLYYFNTRGRGELARLILAAAGKDYEDIRIEANEWPEVKPLMPLGQVPVLQIDGKELMPHSGAISRFLAHEFGLYGSTNREKGNIDAVWETVSYMVALASKLFHAQYKEDKDESTVFTDESMTKCIAYLEKILQSSNTGYFVGNSLTVADLAVFDVQTGMIAPYLHCGSEFPLMKQHKDTVANHEKVRAYVANRPEPLH